MAITQDPPIAEDLIEGFLGEAPEGYNGKARKTWILFFQSLAQGDVTGTFWNPSVSDLTVTGTPTIVGAYYRNNGWTDFWIRITPETDTTSTAGVTYFELPFDVLQDGPCFAVTGLTGSAAGMVEASTNRCYSPAWASATNPVTLTGRVIAQ